MKKQRVALYARVSTTKGSQDESPEHQLDDLRSYFARRDGFEIVMEKTDRAGGSKDERKRPGLAEVMQAARKGRVDVVACKRIDRLFRSLKLWIDTTLELEAMGVAIVYSDYPQLDPTTPMGRLFSQMLAMIAEFFRNQYGQAAIEGKARAEAAGKHCARPLETIPDAVLVMIDTWFDDRAMSWGQVSKALALRNIRQPGRLIKTTGAFRETRPWPKASIHRAYMAWLERGAPGRVQKTPKNAAARIGETTPPAQPAGGCP